MTNNDILRQLRYTFDFSDDKMMEIFTLGEMKTNRAQVSAWLKKMEDPDFLEMIDEELAIFLNGFIVLNRGKKEGPSPSPEQFLNNNAILKKIKIALNFKTEDIIDVFSLLKIDISEHEVTAFLRNYKQSQYRAFNDQYLRNFLHGLQLKYRPKAN